MLTNTDFLQRLFLKHQETPLFPPTSSVCKMVTHIMLLLFPEQTKNHFVLDYSD